MPNARLMKEGSMKILHFFFLSNEYTYITASPFSWLEASYRYTEVKNLLYGPSSYSGNQTLKDKGFDLKIRLLKKERLLPARNCNWVGRFAGTGLFSGEYLVASKKFWRF